MLTQERLKSLALYDPMTGVFTSRKTLQQMGRVTKGRRQIKVGGGDYHDNRLAWLYMTGDWPTGLVDHKNHDTLDCAWINLRDATHSQSLANRRGWGKTGYKGVTIKRGKFRATIKKGKHQTHLGVFDTPEEAYAAYCRAAAVAHGEYQHG